MLTGLMRTPFYMLTGLMRNPYYMLTPNRRLAFSQTNPAPLQERNAYTFPYPCHQPYSLYCVHANPSVYTFPLCVHWDIYVVMVQVCIYPINLALLFAHKPRWLRKVIRGIPFHWFHTFLLGALGRILLTNPWWFFVGLGVIFPWCH